MGTSKKARNGGILQMTLLDWVFMGVIGTLLAWNIAQEFAINNLVKHIEELKQRNDLW